MRYDHFSMLPSRAFQRVGGRMTLEGGKDAEAPDYSQLAAASERAAQLGYELGTDQLDFAKQQYNDLAPFFKELTAQQTEIANQTAEQGLDYYEYQKGFRPVEQQMLSDAMQGRDAEIAEYDAANKADAAKLTMDPMGLYDANRREIDRQVDTAVADSQGAYTRAINQAIRQGLRYGSGMNGIKANVGSLGLGQAQATAAAANSARTAGINDVRGRIATGLQLRQQNMSAKNAEKAVDWAKKLDAAGLVKGLPGASAGAYGLAINAGNSAGQNARAPGQDYMAGMSAGSGTIMNGQGQRIQGLSTIANNQTQMAMNSQNSSNEMLGTALGAGMALMSDARMKENVVCVGQDARTGLGVYEFNYVGGTQRYRGVIAQEVLDVMPSAVARGDDGFLRVRYDLLGLAMVEV